MKKYIIGAFTLLVFGLANSQNYYLATPEGYGAGTTGGGTATPITVSTFADLRTQLISTGAKVILVSGEITIPTNNQISAVVNNKSLIGLPGAKLINLNQTAAGSGILNFKVGSSNVIIRNLIFEGPGAYDVDGRDNLTADGITNLWVDHCEFRDGLDGNFDIKGLSDNITVSWTKFTYLKPAIPGGSGGSNDHRFSNLIGSSATDAPADGHYSVTFQNCYWGEGVKDRMPRARNAQLHILSSYYNTSVSGSKGIGLGGGTNNSTCYVENTNFQKVGTVYSQATGDGGTVAINFVNSLKAIANVGVVSAPTYSTTKIPVEDVEKVMTDSTCGAGASLQVSPTGVITSSPCTFLNVSNTNISKGYRLQCTPIADKKLQVRFPKQVSGNQKFQIFNTAGQLLLTKEEQLKSTEKTTIDLQGLKTGLFMLSVKTDNESSTCKFLNN